MMTHAHCGGVLLPIAVPPLAQIDAFGMDWGGDWRARQALPVRCAECRIEGEVVLTDDPDLERRRLWRGLAPA